MKSMEKSSFTRINGFQDNIAQGRPNQWRCRAGARYLYICEDGLVHYCSQQRGYPAVPLEKYTVDDIRREYLSEKTLRSQLHGFVRPPGIGVRLVARAAVSRSGRGRAGFRRPDPNQLKSISTHVGAGAPPAQPGKARQALHAKTLGELRSPARTRASGPTWV